jgi:hypothetical protein
MISKLKYKPFLVVAVAGGGLHPNFIGNVDEKIGTVHVDPHRVLYSKK